MAGTRYCTQHRRASCTPSWSLGKPGLFAHTPRFEQGPNKHETIQAGPKMGHCGHTRNQETKNTAEPLGATPPPTLNSANEQEPRKGSPTKKRRRQKRKKGYEQEQEEENEDNRKQQQDEEAGDERERDWEEEAVICSGPCAGRLKPRQRRRHTA